LYPKVTISNILGEILLHDRLNIKNQGEYSNTFNISELSSGIYFLSLEFAGMNYASKLVKID